MRKNNLADESLALVRPIDAQTPDNCVSSAAGSMAEALPGGIGLLTKQDLCGRIWVFKFDAAYTRR